MKICFVSPFPPRHDGISEFNQDLINGLKKNNTSLSFIGVAINETDETLNHYYSPEVQFQIRKNHKEDYKEAAAFINKSDCDLVCLELEYALFGGFDGAYVKSLIKNLTKKLVIIIHGLPINSYSRRKKTRENFFREIEPHVSTFITINPLQKNVLQEKWNIKTPTVNILHGAPDEILNYNTFQSKKKLGLQNKLIIFNFGLFHRKKGLEYLLPAYKEFVKTQPDSILILGGKMLTVEKKGSYLDEIKTYIYKHKLENHVSIINKFFERSELYEYLTAADIIVFPYTKRDLVSSGPLSFSALADKFIICTPFPYAKVLLTKETAYFVKYQNSRQINEGFNYYVNNKNNAVTKILEKLKLRGSSIKWSTIAKDYYKVFKAVT